MTWFLTTTNTSNMNDGVESRCLLFGFRSTPDACGNSGNTQLNTVCLWNSPGQGKILVQVTSCNFFPFFFGFACICQIYVCSAYAAASLLHPKFSYPRICHVLVVQPTIITRVQPLRLWPILPSRLNYKVSGE